MVSMDETPPGRGGARPGAGRKPLGDRKRRKTTLLVPPEVLAVLDERARREGVSRSESLARCVREWNEADRSSGTGADSGAPT